MIEHATFDPMNRGRGRFDDESPGMMADRMRAVELEAERRGARREARAAMVIKALASGVPVDVLASRVGAIDVEGVELECALREWRHDRAGEAADRARTEAAIAGLGLFS